MFTKVSAVSYLANPLDREATQLLEVLGRRDNTQIASYIANALAGLSTILGIVLLVKLIATPEDWYQYAGANDWIGIGFFCLCLSIGAGLWKGTHAVDERYQWRKFHQLVRAGRIINVPAGLEAALISRLEVAKMRKFAENTYQLTIHDYETLQETALAEHRGVTTTDDFSERYVTPLLVKLIERIQRSYEDTRATHRGRLEALRDGPPMIEG